MELAIVLLLVFIVWTNEALFGKSLTKAVPPKTAEEEFTAALKKFLDKGIPVRIVEKQEDKKGR
jgi:hypothetical protein